MVTMWPLLALLRWSIIAASVVDLPEPVAPTTITRPRFAMMMLLHTSGRPRPSTVGGVELMARTTTAGWPCCL